MGVTNTIVSKAVKDADFRERLLKDPRAAIVNELRIDVPENVTFQVHENSPTVVHIVLPALERDLSEKELARIAGGGDLTTALHPGLAPLPGLEGPIVGAISPLPWMPIRRF